MDLAGADEADRSELLHVMVLHHEDAIAMADLALVRARRDEIKNLARTIKVNQGRENDQMRRWYRQWYGSDLQRWAPDRRLGMDWQHSRMIGVNMQALRQSIDFDRGLYRADDSSPSNGRDDVNNDSGEHPSTHDSQAGRGDIQRAKQRNQDHGRVLYREWYP
nr:DUF305 domain-containing protein [Cyanobium sp. Alchichica 3B3-8F6]